MSDLQLYGEQISGGPAAQRNTLTHTCTHTQTETHTNVMLNVCVCSQECAGLSWSQRVSVVEGASAALQFLHCPPDKHTPLIHGDVKRSGSRHTTSLMLSPAAASDFSRNGVFSVTAHVPTRPCDCVCLSLESSSAPTSFWTGTWSRSWPTSVWLGLCLTARQDARFLRRRQWGKLRQSEGHWRTCLMST